MKFGLREPGLETPLRQKRNPPPGVRQALLCWAWALAARVVLQTSQSPSQPACIPPHMGIEEPHQLSFLLDHCHGPAIRNPPVNAQRLCIVPIWLACVDNSLFNCPRIKGHPDIHIYTSVTLPGNRSKFPSYRKKHTPSAHTFLVV